MRSVIQPFPAIVGASAATLLFVTLAAGPVAPTPASPHRPVPWPPFPTDIVRLDSAALPGADVYGQLTVPVGAQITLFRVPVDKYFVLTNVGDEANLGGQVLQVLGSTSTLKFFGGGPGSHGGDAPLGYTFAPGSEVVLVNHSDLMGFPFPITSHFMISGYLVDA